MSLNKVFGKELLAKLKEKAGDELYREFEGKIGDKELFVNDGGYIPKEKFDDAVGKARTEAEDYKTQLGELSEKVKKLEPLAKDNEALKSELDKIQNESKEAREALEGKLKKQALDHAVDKVLSEAGARNAKAVRALLDEGKITMDGENILGLTDQLEAVKKEHDYLFGEVKPTGKPPKKGDDPKPVAQFTREQVAAMPQHEVDANLEAINESMKNW